MYVCITIPLKVINNSSTTSVDVHARKCNSFICACIQHILELIHMAYSHCWLQCLIGTYVAISSWLYTCFFYTAIPSSFLILTKIYVFSYNYTLCYTIGISSHVQEVWLKYLHVCRILCCYGQWSFAWFNMYTYVAIHMYRVQCVDTIYLKVIHVARHNFKVFMDLTLSLKLTFLSSIINYISNRVIS